MQQRKSRPDSFKKDAVRRLIARGSKGFQRIAGEAGKLRRLGMSLRSIGAALGVDEKTVRSALSHLLQTQARLDG